MIKFLLNVLVFAALSLSLSAKAEESDAREREYFTDLPLLTQTGDTVRFYNDVLKGHTVMINFIFTDCDGACPILTHKLLAISKALGDEAPDNLRFVSISIDPENDSPAALREFAQGQGVTETMDWVFLTGERANIDHIVKKLGQYSPDPVQHSTLLLAGNVKARHWTKIRPDTALPGIVEQIKRLGGDT